MNYLTKRQKQVLEFIEEFSSKHGISPTHREICEHFGYSSYGTVHKHLKLLQQKGFLRRDWNQKRGLELVRPSASTSEPPLTEVPFYGRIAAGRPIEALPGNDSLPIPPSLLRGPHGDHYVLQVEGDSMIDEGIHNGDHHLARNDVGRP